MDSRKRIFMKTFGEPFLALQKRIKFKKSLDEIVRLELEKLGFVAYKGILGRGGGKIFEFSRTSGRFTDVILYQHTPGYNPYVRTHVELLNEIDITFYLLESESKEFIKLPEHFRSFSPPDGFFPFGGAWAYSDQQSLQTTLRISIEEMKTRGLHWFELVRGGERGEILLSVLGVPKPRLTPEEYERSPWKEKFSYSPN